MNKGVAGRNRGGGSDGRECSATDLAGVFARHSLPLLKLLFFIVVTILLFVALLIPQLLVHDLPPP